MGIDYKRYGVKERGSMVGQILTHVILASIVTLFGSALLRLHAELGHERREKFTQAIICTLCVLILGIIQ